MHKSKYRKKYRKWVSIVISFLILLLTSTLVPLSVSNDCYWYCWDFLQKNICQTNKFELKSNGKIMNCKFVKQFPFNEIYLGRIRPKTWMMTQLNKLCCMTMYYVSLTCARDFKRKIQVKAFNFKRCWLFKGRMWYPQGIGVCRRGQITTIKFTSIDIRIKWSVVLTSVYR